MAWYLFECNREDEVTTRRGIDTLVASSGKSHRFQNNSISDLTLNEELERQAEFCASTQDEA